MDQMAEEKTVSEWDYELFRQAVWNSIGLFDSSADNADGVDMDAGTLIQSGDSHMDKSHEKTNGHRELTVTTVVTAPGPNDHGSVTARRGHSSVTGRSQLSHG